MRKNPERAKGIVLPFELTTLGVKKINILMFKITTSRIFSYTFVARTFFLEPTSFR